MVAYFSAEITAGKPVRDPKLGPVIVKTASFLVATAFADADTIDMIRIPPYAKLLDVVTFLPDLDTGAELVVDVGDDDTVDLFNDGSTLGQTGGALRAAEGLPKTYGADGGVTRITIPTDPATDVTGVTITQVIYFQDSRDRRSGAP